MRCVVTATPPMTVLSCTCPRKSAPWLLHGHANARAVIGGTDEIHRVGSKVESERPSSSADMIDPGVTAPITVPSFAAL